MNYPGCSYLPGRAKLFGILMRLIFWIISFLSFRIVRISLHMTKALILFLNIASRLVKVLNPDWNCASLHYSMISESL
jgi:hypothetical protein